MFGFNREKIFEGDKFDLKQWIVKYAMQVTYDFQGLIHK